MTGERTEGDVLGDERAQRRLVADQFTKDVTRWRDEYQRADYHSRRYQLRAAAAVAMLRSIGAPTGRMLDVGTGAGLQAGAAHECGWEVLGMDLTPAMLEEAAVNQGPTWLVASADAIPFADQTFAVVQMLGLIGYVPDADRALDDAARCLEPGGSLIISCHNRRTLLSMFNHATAWLPRTLRGLARSGPNRGENFYRAHNKSWVPAAFEELLTRHGFQVVGSTAFDYGRLRLFGRRGCGDRFDIRISEFCESLGRRRGFRWLREYAFMSVFIAIKSG